MKLIPQFPAEYPLISQYGNHEVVGRRSKKYPSKHLFFMEWLNKTFPNRYADVKNDDCFIVWNGRGVPVPFLKDNTDTDKRPTRLIDGCYYGLSDETRVFITSETIVIKLVKEVRKYTHNKFGDLV